MVRLVPAVMLTPATTEMDVVMVSRQPVDGSNVVTVKLYVATVAGNVAVTAEESGNEDVMRA
jgi:hypothetical protein